MRPPDIDKAYISPYDKLLHQLELTYPLSASQIKEINKHKRIALMRDDATAAHGNAPLWDKF